jgi:hypothetical protein
MLKLILCISTSLFLLLPGWATAQKVISNQIPIEKTNFPRQLLDTTYQHYLVEVIYPSEEKYSGLKAGIDAADIYSAIELPRYTKLTGSVSEDTRKQLGIIITIKFSVYERTWNRRETYDNTDGHYFVGTIYMPVAISWIYPNNASNNFTYEFKYKPNAEGKFEFKTEVFKGAGSNEEEGNAIKALNKEYMDALKSDLRDRCQNYFPYTSKQTFNIYTLSDKKTDLSRTDEILEVVKRGTSLIQPGDLFANPTAAKELNLAIDMCDKMITDPSLAKMKYVLLHLYMNKQNLELLVGNLTAAEQTYVRYKAEVGGYMIGSLQSPASIGHERFRCDQLGITYQ